jgi:hypothetical protein
MSVNFAELVEPRMFQGGGKVAGLRQAAELLWDKYNRGKTVQPGVFSTLDELIADAPFDEVPASQWRKYLTPGRTLKREGVEFPLKKEELTHSGGLEYFLDLRADEKVGKQEVRAYLQAGRPQYKVDVAREVYGDQTEVLRHTEDIEAFGHRASPITPAWDEVGAAAGTRQSWPMDRVDVKGGPSYGSDFASAEGTPVYHHISPGSTYDESVTRMPGLRSRTHYGPDTLSWSRTTTHNMFQPTVADPAGNYRVRLVEEIQSDLHRKASSKVWTDPTTGENYFDEVVLKQRIEKGEVPPGVLETGQRIGYKTAEDTRRLAELEEEIEGLVEIVDMTPVDDDDLAAINRSGRDIERLRAEAARLDAKVDDAPYKDPGDYAALELRKQLWNAADEGEDYLALTRGADQIERYASDDQAAALDPEKIEKMRAGMTRMYDEIYAGELKRLARRFGLTVEDVELEVMARAPAQIEPPKAGTLENPAFSLKAEVDQADVSPEATAHFDEVWDEIDGLVGELTPGDYHMPMHSELTELQEELSRIKDFVGANFDDMVSNDPNAITKWAQFDIEAQLGHWSDQFDETMKMWTNLQNQGPIPTGQADELIKKTFPAIRLTPEGREKILKTGVQQYGRGGKVEALKRLWRIWDPKDKQWASSTYKNKRAARNKIDKMDNEYGAYRYKLKEVAGKKDPKGTTAFQRGGKAGGVRELLQALRKKATELGAEEADVAAEAGDGMTRRKFIQATGAAAVAGATGAKQARREVMQEAAAPVAAPAARAAAKQFAGKSTSISLSRGVSEIMMDLEDINLVTLREKGINVDDAIDVIDYDDLQSEAFELATDWRGFDPELTDLHGYAESEVANLLVEAGVPVDHAYPAAKRIRNVELPQFQEFDSSRAHAGAHFDVEVEGDDDVIDMVARAMQGEDLSPGSQYNTISPADYVAPDPKFKTLPEGTKGTIIEYNPKDRTDVYPRDRSGYVVPEFKEIFDYESEAWQTRKMREWYRAHPRETWPDDWFTAAEAEARAEGGPIGFQRGGKVQLGKLLRELKKRYEELGGVDEGPEDPTRRKVLAGIGATAIAAPAALKQARYQARPEIAPAVRAAVKEAVPARASLEMNKPLWDLGEDMEEDLIRNLLDEGQHGGSKSMVRHFMGEEGRKQLETDIVEAGQEWGSHRYGGEGHLENLDKARDFVRDELWDAGMPQRDADAAVRQISDVDWPEFTGYDAEVPTRSAVAHFKTEIEAPDDFVRMLNAAREGESLTIGSPHNTFSVIPEGASEQFLKIGQMDIEELIEELPRLKHGVDRGKPIQAVGKRPRENWRHETDRWRRWLQNHPRETWDENWVTRAELEGQAEGGIVKEYAEGGSVDAFENTKRRLALAMVMGSGRLPDEAEIQERMARLTADDDDDTEFGFGDKSGLEIAKSALQSMVGAIPGVGEEGAEYGAETVLHFPASFTSQLKTFNPETGKAEWRLPASMGMIPYEAELGPEGMSSEERAAANREIMEQPFRPGLIDETLAIANIFGTGPEWSKEAEERQFAMRGDILEDYGLEDPSGFLQHLTSAGGMMAGQLPIPMGSFIRLKELAAKLPKAAKWGSALGRWPIEWLSPVIEPSLLTYGGASLFGAAIGTGVEAMLGEEELEPEEAERMLADMMRESEVEQMTPPDETDALIDEDIERRLGMQPGPYREDLPGAF